MAGEDGRRRGGGVGRAAAHHPRRRRRWSPAALSLSLGLSFGLGLGGLSLSGCRTTPVDSTIPGGRVPRRGGSGAPATVERPKAAIGEATPAIAILERERVAERDLEPVPDVVEHVQHQVRTGPRVAGERPVRRRILSSMSRSPQMAGPFNDWPTKYSNCKAVTCRSSTTTRGPIGALLDHTISGCS